MVATSAPRIGIAGAGPVAYALGRLLCRRGQPLVAVASRDKHHAERFATTLGPAVRAVPYDDLPNEATHVVVAVSDAAVVTVAGTLASHGMRGVALHTCGAYGGEVLAPLRAQGVACGVLHPLQSFSSAGDDAEALRGITFTVGGDREAVEWGASIASLADGSVVAIEDAQRPRYHAAAVLASNALVAAIDAAVMLLERTGMDRDVALRALTPLASTTLDNTLRRGPLAAITGPVGRGDAPTVARHLEALRDEQPAVAHLYRAAAEQLLDIARRRGLDAARVRAVESALGVQG